MVTFEKEVEMVVAEVGQVAQEPNSAVCGRGAISSSTAFPMEQVVRQKENFKAKEEAGGKV